MKVTPTDLATIREAIAPLDTADLRSDYRAGRFARADRVQDLDKRYRWDLYWTVFRSMELDRSEYNDVHMDTALRAVVAPL